MGSIYIISIILAITVAILVYLLFSKRNLSRNQEENVTFFNEMKELRRDLERLTSQQRTEVQQKLDVINDRLFRGSNEQSTQLQSNLKQTSEMIQTLVTQFTSQFKEQSGEFQSTQKQVLTFGSQLADLQNILKNPKQRGILGEYFLETVLQNTMGPESFRMQYAFKDGEIVDAVVFVKDKIVPIDSKFSLENYNRLAIENNPTEKDRLEKLFVNDLKLRVKETSKYIRPEEGTVDFAFMFVPHEAIYYDLLINKIGVIGEDTENILQRAARDYHVIIVSPTTFLAYLQTVLQGLKAIKIEERTKEIQQRIFELGKHLESYTDCFQSVGKHISTAANQYNLASKEFAKIDKDVYRITDGQVGKTFEAIEAEKPAIE